MRSSRIRWGKLKLEVPSEILLPLLYKLIELLHQNIGQRRSNTRAGCSPA